MMQARAWVSVLSAAALAALTGVAATQETPIWEHILKDQLLVEQQCELNYMTNIKTEDLGQLTSIQGRAHCSDGRAFDVRSLGGGSHFELRECGIAVC